MNTVGDCTRHAEAHQSLGKFSESVDLFSRAIELGSPSASLLAGRSASFSALGHFDRALVDADEALRLDPRSASAHLRRVQALRGLGRVEESSEAVEEGIRAVGSDEALTIERVMLGNSVLQAMLADPRVIGLGLTRPELYARLLMQPEQLESILAQAGQPQPTTPASVSKAPSETSEFYGMFRRALKSRPIEELKAKADDLFRRRQFESAIEAYNDALAESPGHALLLSNKAGCLIELGRLSQALQVVDTALAGLLDTPDRPALQAKLLLRKGRILFLQERLEAADAAFAESQKLAPSTQATDGRAAVDERRAQLRGDEAKAAIEVAEARLLIDAGNLKEALIKLDEAKKADRLYRPGFELRVQVLRKMKGPKVALDVVREAEELGVTNWALLKAELYEEAGELHRSLQHYKEAKDPEGTRRVIGKIESMMAKSAESGQVERASQDPLIHAILNDPIVHAAMEKVKKRPKLAEMYLTDKVLGPKLMRLIQAGVLKLPSASDEPPKGKFVVK